MSVFGAWDGGPAVHMERMREERDAAQESAVFLAGMVGTMGSERDAYRAALVRIRDAVADMCPAWALEWPTVREVMELEGEDYTAQDVRDCVAPALNIISEVLSEVQL